MRRHERLLGVRIDSAAPARFAGMDFVVVPAGRAGVALSGGALPVLAEVDSADAARVALRAGADGLVVVGPAAVGPILDAVRGSAGWSGAVLVLGGAEHLDLPDDDAVIAGRARLVASAAEARAAGGSGTDAVIVDVAAATDRLLAEVASLRSSVLGPRDAAGRPPLVLLSGMLGDATLWDGVAAQLGDVVLPWPARIDRDDSVGEMAASVLAEAPPRFLLAGHSLGGIVALEILRRAPQRVTGVVLVCSSARGAVDAQLRAWQRLRARCEAGEFADVAEEMARATLPVERHEDADLLDRNEQMAWTVGDEGFLRQLAAQATRPDSLDSLPAIRVPVLVLSGGRDEVCPPHLQQEIVDRCPDAELVTVASGGHMLPLECPDQVAAAVAGWLTRSGLGAGRMPQ